MISEFVDSELDQLQRDTLQSPDYRILLYSRWIDSDSDIVNGAGFQTPIDLTPFVVSGSLSLSGETDASTLSLQIALTDRVSVDQFFNCAVMLFEGDSRVPSENWPATFFGYHVGQPQATEANQQASVGTDASFTQRGSVREVSVTFVSRARLFANANITSPGVWLPMGDEKASDPELAARNDYDDIGSIAREIATAAWGMGLTGGEVNISDQPYRIEKQLQVVATSVLEAISTILQPMHLVPYFNGRGVLSTYSQRVTKAVVRTYSSDEVVDMPQQSRTQRLVNALKVTGLESELSEIIHADQRLLSVQGTFGYFDSDMEFRGTWSEDETRSFRVKLGVVTDGKGVTVTSPRIVNFEQDGFIIQPVNFPEFTRVTEFDYEIEITNDVFLVVAAIALMLGGYTASVLLTTIFPEISGAPGSSDFPNPAAIISELASAALLIGGLAVLRQIGNFQFEVHGVPYETVYREITHTAILNQFAAFDSAGGTAIRDYEKVEESIENHIFSSLEDRTTNTGVVNVGLQTWAEQKLAFLVAQGASRTLRVPRDILLEPGDVVQFGRQVVFVENISRTLQRGQSDPQVINGFQIRKATA